MDVNSHWCHMGSHYSPVAGTATRVQVAVTERWEIQIRFRGANCSLNVGKLHQGLDLALFKCRYIMSVSGKQDQFDTLSCWNQGANPPKNVHFMELRSAPCGPHVCRAAVIGRPVHSASLCQLKNLPERYQAQTAPWLIWFIWISFTSLANLPSVHIKCFLTRFRENHTTKSSNSRSASCLEWCWRFGEENIAKIQKCSANEKQIFDGNSECHEWPVF